MLAQAASDLIPSLLPEVRHNPAERLANDIGRIVRDGLIDLNARVVHAHRPMRAIMKATLVDKGGLVTLACEDIVLGLD